MREVVIAGPFFGTRLLPMHQSRTKGRARLLPMHRNGTASWTGFLPIMHRNGTAGWTGFLPLPIHQSGAACRLPSKEAGAHA